MSVETFGTIGGLNTAWPANSDLIAEGDDHIRGVKITLKTVFPNFGAGVLTATPAVLNYSVGLSGPIQAQLDDKAPINAPSFTGGVDIAGGLDVLGTVTLPTSTSIGDVSATELESLNGVTAPLQGQLNAKAPLVSPALTGVPTVPTAAPGTNTTQAASTAFVAAAAFSTALPAQSGNARKVIRTNGAAAAWDFVRRPEVPHAAGGPIVTGANNVITAAGVTLTVPALVAGDEFEVTNASNSAGVFVDFGGYSINNRSVLPGVMTLDSLTANRVFAYNGTTLLTVG